MKYPNLHRAIEFAVQAHMGQDRKYSELPYIAHPISVMQIVRSVTSDEDMLAAAVLHDVVEDPPVTIEQVFELFGERAGALVADLTDVSKPEDGNRTVRKSLDRAHTAAAHPDAKTVKLADLIHNAESITANDEHFARVFMQEKAALLDVLKGANDELWERAHQTLQNYQENRLQQRLRS